MILETVALVLAVLFFIAGLIVSVFGIGGTFLVFGGAVIYDLVTWSWAVSLQMLVILLGIAVLGEAFEWVLSAYGGKKLKLSTFTIVGMILGIIVGGFVGVPIPVFGSIAGIFLGALLGAFVFALAEHKDFGKAVHAAFGAVITRLGVSAMKLALSIAMIVIFYFELRGLL